MPKVPRSLQRQGEYTFNVERSRSTESFVAAAPQPPEPNRVVSLETSQTDEQMLYSTIYDFGIDIDTLLDESITSRRAMRNQRKGITKPPRPQNPFMLFRRRFSKMIKKQSSQVLSELIPMLIDSNLLPEDIEKVEKLFEAQEIKVKSSLISKVAGIYWNGVGEPVKKLFEAAARVAEKRFFEKYPEYKYTPRRTSANASKTSDAIQTSDDAPSPASTTSSFMNGDIESALSSFPAETFPENFSNAPDTSINDFGLTVTMDYPSPVSSNYPSSITSHTPICFNYSPTIPIYVTPSPTISPISQFTSPTCSDSFASPLVNYSIEDNFETGNLLNFSPLSSITINEDQVALENYNISHATDMNQQPIVNMNYNGGNAVDQFSMYLDILDEIEHVTDTNMNCENNKNEDAVNDQLAIGDYFDIPDDIEHVTDTNQQYVENSKDKAEYCDDEIFQNDILNNFSNFKF